MRSFQCPHCAVVCQSAGALVDHCDFRHMGNQRQFYTCPWCQTSHLSRDAGTGRITYDEHLLECTKYKLALISGARSP